MTRTESIKKVSKICKAVLKLTDEDLQHIKEMADEQIGYTHPLKMGTANRFHEMGKHNASVLIDLSKLRDTLIKGEAACKKY